MSSIITSNIDENFPVPGQDNNSQGFRDNFNNITQEYDKKELIVQPSDICDLKKFHNY